MKRSLLLAIFCSVSLFAQSPQDPRIGTWKLNPVKSQFAQAPPRMSVRRYEMGPNGFVVDTTIGLDSQGNPVFAQITFKLDGKEYRLDPVLEDKDKLFFIFSDSTSGKATYWAGRFLYADLPEGETVVLDFNKAENPPCAFTPFATCPLPPRQNRLRVAIEAGELNYHSTSKHKSLDGQ